MITKPTYDSWTKTMFKYHHFSGSWAWIFHRISGLALTLYIFIHITALMSLQKGPDAFNSEMALFRSLIFMFLEWALFSVVIYHTLNGIRICLVDFGNGARYHKPLYYGTMILSLVGMLVMAYIMFGHQAQSITQSLIGS